MNGKRGRFPFPSRRFISLATEEVLFLKTNKKNEQKKKLFLLLLFFSFSLQLTQG